MRLKKMLILALMMPVTGWGSEVDLPPVRGVVLYMQSSLEKAQERQIQQIAKSHGLILHARSGQKIDYQWREHSSLAQAESVCRQLLWQAKISFSCEIYLDSHLGTRPQTERGPSSKLGEAQKSCGEPSIYHRWVRGALDIPRAIMANLGLGRGDSCHEKVLSMVGEFLLSSMSSAPEETGPSSEADFSEFLEEGDPLSCGLEGVCR